MAKDAIGAGAIVTVCAVAIVGVGGSASFVALVPPSPVRPAAHVYLPPVPGDRLRPVAEFAAIADDRARAQALFEEAGKVLRHPRCVNCHPAGDTPLQTNRMQRHDPPLARGPENHGPPGLPCDSCHHDRNFEPARVPGDPHWRVAPIAMAWEGRTLGEICRQIVDPARNGGRDLPALLHHVEADSLVAWAWRPGADRTPAPGSQAELAALMRGWAAAGAHCPSP
jgi:hypothetical protein